MEKLQQQAMFTATRIAHEASMLQILSERRVAIRVEEIEGSLHYVVSKPKGMSIVADSVQCSDTTLVGLETFAINFSKRS